MRTLSTAELQRAGAALLEGRFRSTNGALDPKPHALQVGAWHPDEDVIVVAGVAGRVGTTTIALAAATGLANARLVEASPLQASGLSIASTAELGVDSDGWRSANRDGLRIERRAFDDPTPDQVPPPARGSRTTTVVDLGWSLSTHSSMNGGCWLGQALEQYPLVLVTCATAPGMRSLEAALTRTDRDDITVIATGPSSSRRWSKATRQTLDACPLAAGLAAAGRVHPIALTRALADGLTDTPLPAALVTAVAGPIAPLLTPKGTHHVDSY